MIDSHISDIKWMKRAIYLASLGKGRTSPNPMVGAVILDKNGNLISEGFHSKSGLPHAEAMAFSNLKKDARDGTIYVNLEPCSHHNNTPPCADLILKHKIKKNTDSTFNDINHSVNAAHKNWSNAFSYFSNRKTKTDGDNFSTILALA